MIFIQSFTAKVPVIMVAVKEVLCHFTVISSFFCFKQIFLFLLLLVFFYFLFCWYICQTYPLTKGHFLT